MRVLTWPTDDGGCGSYRLLLPSAVLRSNSGIEIVEDPECKAIQVEWSRPWGQDPTGVDVIGVQPIDFDVWVIQRPLDRHIVDMIPFVQANGTAVVIELDDDFWSIHHDNVAYKTCHPKYSPQRNFEHLARACRLADRVTVSTPPLSRLVPSMRVSVLRNCIPESYLTTKRHADANWDIFGERLRVGWSGSPLTHPDDLQVMGDSPRRAIRELGDVFFSIGSKVTPTIMGFDQGEAACVGWVEFDKYASVVCGLNVGLVPLRMTRFNESKSWLKGLEYAALGVPFVTSPTGEYRTLHAKGAGDLASSSYKWYTRLHRLLVNSEYREERREKGREAASLLTYELHAHEWAEAWEVALFDYKHRPLRRTT